MIDPNSNSFWRRRPRAKSSNAKSKILLFFSIMLASFGQILLKVGVTSLGGVAFDGGAAAELFRIFTCPYVVLGLFCIALNLLVWMTIISKLELSFAYPFASLSYALILLIGWLVLSERVSAFRIAGVVVITIGVILVSRTEKKAAGV